MSRLPHAQVQGYVKLYWKTLATLGQCMPAYIQLDHVYGLDGFDLNMSSIPSQINSSSSSSLSANSVPSSSSYSSSSSSSLSTNAFTDVETSVLSECISSSNDAVPALYESSCSLSSSASLALTSSLSSSLALAVSNKSTIYHCMFPSKRPRFIVQR